jgi:hypothetical protein
MKLLMAVAIKNVPTMFPIVNQIMKDQLKSFLSCCDFSIQRPPKQRIKTNDVRFGLDVFVIFFQRIVCRRELGPVRRSDDVRTRSGLSNRHALTCLPVHVNHFGSRFHLRITPSPRTRNVRTPNTQQPSILRACNAQPVKLKFVLVP